MSVTFMERAADRLGGEDDDSRRRAALAVKRAALLAECPTPAHLAARFDPTYVRTEAGDLIAARIVEAMTAYDGRLTVSQPPQTGKALALDTPIATPTGWTTMGELRPGDQVFDRRGEVCNVVGLSPIWYDRPCFTVRTGDREAIVADAAHEWVARLDRRSPEAIHETRTLAKARAKNAQITGPAGLNLPDADLPIDPYVLGAWLGDGDTSGSGFTSADPEITDRIRDAGYTVEKSPGRQYRWNITRLDDRRAARAEAYRMATEDGIAVREACRRVGLSIGTRLAVPGLRKGQHSGVACDPSLWKPLIKSFVEELRELRVLNDKHVPVQYLRGSEKQRLALLQGLVDTDGTVTAKGQTVYYSTNRRLADAVQHLVYSLGAKATVREYRAKLDGRDCGPAFKVAFYMAGSAWLSRKAERCKDSSVARTRYTWAEPADSVPVRCIEVDSPDHTYLAGRSLLPTHNSLTLRWMCVWLLLRDPDTRIVFASYAAALARTSGRIIRSLIETHGGSYGLVLDRSHADAADWQLDGHLGGVYAVGTGGSLTGRASSAMIIDDPHRSQADADSPTMRDNVTEWWNSVARTRLAPGAPVVGVATRWHEADLISTFITEGWPVVNIPAQADGETPDSLARQPGEYLVTPRGTTEADWVKTRKEAGERTWASLYQGRPAPLAGGVFKAAWFDTWRVPALPAGCLPPTVVVDPADNEGSGDEAGIIVAAQHPDGRVYILDDLSAPMTVARWARTALLVCVRRDAPTLAYEQSLSQLPNRIGEAWAELHLQALALVNGPGPRPALDRLTRPDDTAERRAAIEVALAELTPADAAAIVRIGQGGPRLRPITAKGSKETRMLWAAPLFETGRAVMVGTHARLEYQAQTWSPGQDSPDRVDAMVHACALDLDPRPRVRWLG